MDLTLAFVVFAALMAGSLAYGYSMLWALAAGFIGFMGVGLRRGFALPALLRMAWKGVRESLIVVRVMLTIGVLTGLWRAAGTFALLTAWGLRLLSPSTFILEAFLLSCTLSYALGSSFGTAGTLGVALMTVARSGGVNELAAAGAILSGIYFGDRASPASSCANLVAALTSTDLYDNVKLMMRTALLPLLLALGLHTWLSFRNPMLGGEGAVLTSLNLDFHLSPWCALPALVMLVLPLFKVKVLHSFGVSILCAFLCAVLLQRTGTAGALRFALMGFHAPEGSVRAIFNGGGLVSMLEISAALMISGTYAGIFDGTGILRGLQSRLARAMDALGAYPVTLTLGTLANAIFCNQTVAVMMTVHVVRHPYEERDLPSAELAQDIANSTVITAGMVPWCIGCSVPLTMMGVGAGAVPYAAYLYLLPLCYLLTRRRWFRG